MLDTYQSLTDLALAEYDDIVTGTQFVGGAPASPNKLRLVLIDGSFLDIGLVQVTVMKGNCRRCGYPVTWYATDRYIERIKKARR